MQLKSKQELLRTAWDDQIAKNKVMREIMNSEEKLKNNWLADTERQRERETKLKNEIIVCMNQKIEELYNDRWTDYLTHWLIVWRD